MSIACCAVTRQQSWEQSLQLWEFPPISRGSGDMLGNSGEGQRVKESMAEACLHYNCSAGLPLRGAIAITSRGPQREQILQFGV